MAKTVIALFDDLKHAHRAVEELRRSRHFSSEDITLMAHDADNRYSRFIQEKHVEKTESTKAGTGAATGAGIGGVVGAIAGFLVGAGVIFIPGLGPVLAAGPLVTTLVGLAGGAAAGGIVGGLIGLGIPEDEAHLYAEGLRRGGTLVIVRADDAFADDAADILSHHKPVDVEQRSRQWRESGWTGRFDPESDTWNEQRIHRERESLGDDRPHGRARTYHAQSSPLADEAYSDFEHEYRRHFSAHRASGDRFEDVEEGYRFGTMLGADERYANRTWEEVEAEASQSWTDRTRKSWDKFKSYVAYAWYKTKSELWDVDSTSPSY